MHRPRIRNFALRARRVRTERSRPGAGVAIAPTRRLGVLVAICLTMFGVTRIGFAADPAAPAQSALSLDEQVQEIKSDVLAIAAELSNLEERLLYPSNTQIAVFVALEANDPLSLDAARISIDGELVAHHIYSFKEIEALQKGGVQRLYTGNVPTGGHRLEVAITGKRGGDKDFELVEQFAFSKEVDPKLVGITLGGGIAGSTTIAIEDW